jgi:hypothetical protein
MGSRNKSKRNSISGRNGMMGALHKAAHIKELESGAGRYFPAQLLGRRVLLPSLLLYSASSGAGKVASELALPPSAFCGD